ncbi:MAG TPA: amidohydrolase family protein [Verrucomicrobiae bacterium]
MKQSTNRLPRILLSLGLLSTFVSALIAAEFLPPGHRPKPLGIHALTNATVIPQPGQSLNNATVLIRHGKIEAVGKDVAIPADARVHDLTGCTIYAGFIDAALALGTNSGVALDTSGSEPIRFASGNINFFGVPGEEKDPGNAGPGYELKRITPEFRVAATYRPNAKTFETMRDLGFTAGNVIPAGGIMQGTSAFVQLNEANPNEAVLRADVFQHIVFDPTTKDDSYPGSLMGVISAVRQTFFDAQYYAQVKAAPDKARLEFNPALEALQPALKQDAPVWFEPGSILMVDRAARVANELKLKFVIYSSGQEWRRPELAAATGASFIVPLNFPAAPKLPSDDDWLDVSLDQLRVWDWAAENPAVLRQQGREIALTTRELGEKKDFRQNTKLALQRGLSADDALAALTTVPAKLCRVDGQLGTIAPGKLANLTVVKGASYFNSEDPVQEVWIEGERFSASEKKEAKKDDAKEKEKKDKEPKGEDTKRVARGPQEDRQVLATPKFVLIHNATIWTSGPQGILTNASLLVNDGKIQAIGVMNVELIDNIFVIDAQGKHITPGLIDAHSHSMILGDVNESTLPSTAMVRIGDVVNSETENIYKQLAGGLTVANLLHGSANPIGGQNQIIKLKQGASPEELKFPDAPMGIKFALGENVKQSNWGEKVNKRFPQSRMGVPTFMANRFLAAQQYLAEWDKFKRDGGLAPKRNLELEAIGEILNGQRWIHCHSYRQDEILAFLRVMESFKVKVGTLQHVLEGYKVADEIAKHGAGGSCFSDWWGYKFEVYDAIPHAGSLMRDRGVLVSFNSDSSDLARRMYLEAAKAVKYGNTPEIEALNFVTINPAKQLRIDKRVGSLEVGKDADFALWTKSPLDNTTLCLETWIDGKKYFDRSLDAARTDKLVKEREALIAKAKRLSGDKKDSDSARAAFFRRALETAKELEPVHCLDCTKIGGQP